MEKGVEVEMLGKSQTAGLDELRKQNFDLGYFAEAESPRPELVQLVQSRIRDHQPPLHYMQFHKIHMDGSGKDVRQTL